MVPRIPDVQGTLPGSLLYFLRFEYAQPRLLEGLLCFHKNFAYALSLRKGHCLKAHLTFTKLCSHSNFVQGTLPEGWHDLLLVKACEE
jgi:hypothetical protein